MTNSNFAINCKRTKQSFISFKKLKSSKKEIMEKTKNNYVDKELFDESSPVPIPFLQDIQCFQDRNFILLLTREFCNNFVTNVGMNT